MNVPIIEMDALGRDEILLSGDFGMEGPPTYFMHPLMAVQAAATSADDWFERINDYIAREVEQAAESALWRLDKAVRDSEKGETFRRILRDLEAL